LNWWTAVAFVPCILTGLGGGALGGAAGYILVLLFDDPKIRWNFKSAFLFNVFFALTYAMVFGLLAIGLEREAAARGEVYNRVTFGVSLISSFLATALGGVLNNLRDDS
jgi:hypothetical protein